MSVKVTCESDQGLEGIVRIIRVEIKDDNGSDCNEIENRVFNKLSDKEYNTNEYNWEIEVKSDISIEVGCEINDVSVR